ncbi:aminoglycoside phosphotransferase family protein [Ktedonosporobacter rubrisoli]|uniref:Aminoglycoside phosphotransferase family protein n=2 Tax=Ktedonosporobacter rubrisoli TaxID=2509675 RepID=A0A4P6K623_KTERU|nr:aminoglycoside phosphotransferase family protein [Ktedonosporobacter rubrisoli]
MHSDEVDIDSSLVGRLLAAQFPQWAHLPIKPVLSAGTDNAIYRLGADMAVRLPRIEGAIDQINKELLWLPRLAPHLPLAVPVPLAVGAPGESYPWNWSIYKWLEGESADNQRTFDKDQAARDMAQFIVALHQLDPAGWPLPKPPKSSRGGPLSSRDASTRAAIAELSTMLDSSALTEEWEAALDVPVWQGSPVWTHGDLLPGNLLLHEGRISAIIDFGVLGVGDPACDLIVAWSLLSAHSRQIFRAALPVDDATWARGRGWALSIGLIALPYYQNTNPVFAATARYMIGEVLADRL